MGITVHKFSRSLRIIHSKTLTREVITLPKWFNHDRDYIVNEDCHCLLLADSQGDNFDDLLAAWTLNKAHKSKIQVILMDDQRNPQLCAQTLECMFDCGIQVDAVIGHFSSQVAHSAAHCYKEHGIPFFAPGSSADDLSESSTFPIIQLFARDSGQIAEISAELGHFQSAVVVGQKANAGETLLAKLQETMPCELSVFTKIYDIPPGYISGKPLVLLGSKEFVAEALTVMSPQEQPSTIYLSDDSLNSTAIQDIANKLKLPIFVAALNRPKEPSHILGYEAESIEREATHLLGRPPGPYFLTSWIAIYLAIWTLERGRCSPSQLLHRLQRSDWQTPYGSLYFDDFGRANGFEWKLRSVPLTDGQFGALVSSRPKI